MTTQIPDDLIAALIRLGFSQYEAQAYCALLQRSPMNGHEVGKLSHVPPSKIYETLQRLDAKGAILAHRSEPVRYAAVPYVEVLARIRARFEGDLNLIDKGLSSLPAAREPGLVWSLRDQTAIVTAFNSTIESAKTSLFAAVWDEEMPLVRNALEAAANRGVDVHVAIYGMATLAGPRCYDLRECGESARRRLGGRRLSVVVADEQDAITAEFGALSIDEAVITNNSVISLLAIEYVKADVMGRLLINSMGKVAFEKVLAGEEMRALLGLLPQTPLPMSVGSTTLTATTLRRHQS
ncbi:TrmB family transcriptional regulator [Paraburkholderia sp.]|uniref:TrmB family transcriptional regulator n=1 Tax=Paraburkholderia sp. TaxID=1926495 RepID=UPI00238DA4B9|nr:TrmB family transcriptional regulator [Paraburkholderia sp.]MDE1180632.1 helix-turn-helix domain-containing protein [Paraburkholderia sp.]